MRDIILYKIFCELLINNTLTIELMFLITCIFVSHSDFTSVFNFFSFTTRMERSVERFFFLRLKKEEEEKKKH